MQERVLTIFEDLDKVNNEMRLISINARIEASKSAEDGKKFSVIAEEMSNAVKKLNTSLDDLKKNLK